MNVLVWYSIVFLYCIVSISFRSIGKNIREIGKSSKRIGFRNVSKQKSMFCFCYFNFFLLKIEKFFIFILFIFFFFIFFFCTWRILHWYSFLNRICKREFTCCFKYFFFSTFIPIIFFSTVLIFFGLCFFAFDDLQITNYFSLLLSLIKFSILIILDLLDILLIYKICIQLINTFKSNWLILSLIANILHDYWTNISICLASILDFFHYFSKISYILNIIKYFLFTTYIFFLKFNTSFSILLQILFYLVVSTSLWSVNIPTFWFSSIVKHATCLPTF